MKIVFTIPKRIGASPTMEVLEAKGPSCLKTTEDLRDMLVGGASGLKRKPEFKEVDTCQKVSS